MSRSSLLFITVLTLAGGLAGCRTRPDDWVPAQSTKYSIEGTDKFSVQERPQRVYVACTGLQEKINVEGRLEVVANVQNRENRPLTLEVRCVFKDAQGFSTGDETPWESLALEEYSTEAVHYTAANGLAKKFTIVVRAAAP